MRGPDQLVAADALAGGGHAPKTEIGRVGQHCGEKCAVIASQRSPVRRLVKADAKPVAMPSLAERSRVLLKDGHVIVMDDTVRIDCPIAGFHAVIQVWSCRREQADYWMVETRVGRAAVEGWVAFCDRKLTDLLRRQLGPGFVAGHHLACARDVQNRVEHQWPISMDGTEADDDDAQSQRFYDADRP